MCFCIFIMASHLIIWWFVKACNYYEVCVECVFWCREGSWVYWMNSSTETLSSTQNKAPRMGQFMVTWLVHSTVDERVRSLPAQTSLPLFCYHRSLWSQHVILRFLLQVPISTTSNSKRNANSSISLLIMASFNFPEFDWSRHYAPLTV